MISILTWYSKMETIFCLSTFFLLFAAVNSECNYKGLEVDPDYDIAIAPSFGNDLVHSKLKVLKIFQIDDSHTTMTLVLKIYLTWLEPRIQINQTSPETKLLRLLKRIKSK